MTALGRGFDLLLWGVATVIWGLAAYVFSSQVIGTTAGALFGLAVAFSSMGYVLHTHLRDTRMEALTAGVCPSCRAPVIMEHQHRRWDAATRSWAAPATGWECAVCSYSHDESWPCPQCPEA